MTFLAGIGVAVSLLTPVRSDHHPTGVERIKQAITWSFCGHSLRPCSDGNLAQRIAWCESRFDRWAQNGQYLGLFQMGSHERWTYGHGPTAWDQAQAANRYQNVSGWSPWYASIGCWG